MDRPVSVVIPTHAGRATLARALDSLLPNAAHIAEVLLVLSNSSADYAAWCASTAQSYRRHFGVQVLDSPAPSNAAIARNVGIAAAAAPYVAFLDDDDEWMAHKLSCYLAEIDRRGLNGDFVLFSTVVSCREDRSDWLLFPRAAYRGQPVGDFLFCAEGGIQTSAILLPTVLARRVGFDSKLIRHTDYDFCIRLAEAGAAFHALIQPLSYWYRRGSVVAKGATFEYCAQWLRANQHRISRAAFIGYIEKDLLSSARTSGRWRDFLRLQRAQLNTREWLGSMLRLGVRALRKLSRSGRAGRRGIYQGA
ncbi:MAG: glycosyltransferase family 2 protein [Steroidobacteraceae bacterium]